MAHAVADTNRRPHMGLPLPNGKLAMWLFLVTEIMFFTGLIGTYIILRNGTPTGDGRALADAARRPPGRMDRRLQHLRADLQQLDGGAGPLGAGTAATSSRRPCTSASRWPWACVFLGIKAVRVQRQVRARHPARQGRRSSTAPGRRVPAHVQATGTPRPTLGRSNYETARTRR